ncbi:hypothetical protein [Amycolatopsis sp. CA-230715]|nr:hypothetical protein [Amycolatopsis sp. CA-230715]QWF80661.1 hypothetical protein HUW46_04084 [Amycolatopsis sp. CA-230715]
MSREATDLVRLFEADGLPDDFDGALTLSDLVWLWLAEETVPR